MALFLYSLSFVNKLKTKREVVRALSRCNQAGERPQSRQNDIMVLYYRTNALRPFRVMPKEGIEPSIPKEHEFESCASACSATPANGYSITNPANKVKAKSKQDGLEIHSKG